MAQELLVSPFRFCYVGEDRYQARELHIAGVFSGLSYVNWKLFVFDHFGETVSPNRG